MSIENKEFLKWCDDNNVDSMRTPSPDAYGAGLEVWLKMKHPLLTVPEQPVDCAKILNEICEEFGIGRHARDRSTILENVRNSSRRSWCLTKIESFLSRTVKGEEEGEEYEEEESLLNWGECPA